MNRRKALSNLAALGAAPWAGAVCVDHGAESYPSKPLKVMVHHASGTILDVRG